MWCKAAPIHGFVCILRYVFRNKLITGGCELWLSNIIVEDVIEVDELNKDNTSAAAGKLRQIVDGWLSCATFRIGFN